jgi:predicted patatin/cPLA2 family phospholipase
LQRRPWRFCAVGVSKHREQPEKGSDGSEGANPATAVEKPARIPNEFVRRARAAGLGLIPKLLRRRTSDELTRKSFFHEHEDNPVLLVMHQRRAHGSRPGHRHDPYRIGLVIEGGGMRGSIAAGMCAALGYLGFLDTFDVVFGSSAGAICGAYLISRQLPVYGPSIYFEDIANERFIDTRALWRPTRAQSGGRPVLDLDFLLDEVMVHSKPLDWATFVQHNSEQPLRPVASSLKQARSVAFRGFSSYEELRNCLRASARVPGIAGPPVQINDDVFADGILFEAIPYRSALADGCTHVLVLRTRPIGTRVPRIAGIYERMIAAPELKSFPQVREYIIRGGHFRQYLRDIRLLEDPDLVRHAHVSRILGEQWTPGLPQHASLLSIGPLHGDTEISQLETRPEVIFEATRYGFELAFEMLNAPYKRPVGDGARIARMVFSDERLDEILRLRAAIRRQIRGVQQDAVALKRLQRIWFLRRFRKGSPAEASTPHSRHSFVTEDYLSSLPTRNRALHSSSLDESSAAVTRANGNPEVERLSTPENMVQSIADRDIPDQSQPPDVGDATAMKRSNSRKGFLFLPRLTKLRLIQKQSR